MNNVMLYHAIMGIISIWTLSSIAFWCFAIWSVVAHDSEMLAHIYINNMWQLVCALLFPFIYIGVILIIWFIKFFRNIFTIFI